MRGINMKMILLPILLMSMLATMIAVKPISAQSTTVNLNPTFILGKNPGDAFTVDIMVNDVTDLYGYELKIFADINVLTATGIDVGAFFANTTTGYKTWKQEIGYTEDYTKSYAWLAVTKPLGSAAGESGSGILATVHFVVYDAGSTDLNLALCVLGDPFGNAIPHTWTSGYFTTMANPTFAADIVKRRSTNRPVDYSFKYPSAGSVEVVLGEVENLGDLPVLARVKFVIVDETGAPPPGGVERYSPNVWLLPGERAVVSAGVTIDSTMVGLRYYVTNYCQFDGNADGIPDDAQGASTTSYSFVVVSA